MLKGILLTLLGLAIMGLNGYGITDLVIIILIILYYIGSYSKNEMS